MKRRPPPTKAPPPLALHQFKNKKLEELALTHRSFGKPNNERLEWLGDACLDFAVSRLLYERFADADESALTLMRSNLVNGEALAALARRVGLPPHLRLGGAKAAGGRNNGKILAGAMEAYIAAVFLDGGNAPALLASLLADDIERLRGEVAARGARALGAAKTRLQERLQRAGLPPPQYAVCRRSGAAHSPLFEVECRATPQCAARATASTIAAAQRAAAAECLKKLQA